MPLYNLSYSIRDLLCYEGEETASAKIKDFGPVPRTTKRIETARTIYFECNYMVWCGANNGQVRGN